MNDDRRTIGTSGTAGRGNRSTPPSAAARSLAGAKAAPKKPVTKAKAVTKPAEPKTEPKKEPAKK